MTALPREINYAPKLNALPSNTSCLSAVVAPSNGQSFADGGSIIQFDLPSRGYLVPGSMYIRYKIAVASATTAPVMKATPVYTPFARLETICGSAIIESIQNYNQLSNIIVNTKLNYAQKAGLAYGFGLINNSTTPAFDNLNGRTLSAVGGETWTMSAPLGCLLSNADHLVPLGKMPGCRIQLTTEVLANCFTTTTQTSFTLSNMELCFDLVDFGSEVDSIVDSMADENGNIYIKSQSYSSSTQTIANGTVGTIELVYNQRLSSIKSVIANFGKATNNTFFDSVDITSNNGDYQLLIASQPYPPRPISTSQNKAGAIMELNSCWGPCADIGTSNMSITPLEFSRVSNTATTALIPGKYWFGVNTERLSTAGNLLTGVSSQLSPISLRVNLGTQTAEVHSCTLITCYDALIEVNCATRQVAVKQ